jgi:predicted metalloendopeptidase
MLADIQWAFSSLVSSVDWMDEDTKIVTLEKAAAMRHFVGFPEWLLDRDELETYYEGVSELHPYSKFAFKFKI